MSLNRSMTDQLVGVGEVFGFIEWSQNRNWQRSAHALFWSMNSLSFSFFLLFFLHNSQPFKLVVDAFLFDSGLCQVVCIGYFHEDAQAGTSRGLAWFLYAFLLLQVLPGGVYVCSCFRVHSWSRRGWTKGIIAFFLFASPVLYLRGEIWKIHIVWRASEANRLGMYSCIYCLFFLSALFPC